MVLTTNQKQGKSSKIVPLNSPKNYDQQWQIKVDNTINRLLRFLLNFSYSTEELAKFILCCVKDLMKSQFVDVAFIDLETNDLVANNYGQILGKKYEDQNAQHRVVFPVADDGNFPIPWCHALNICKGFYTNSPNDDKLFQNIPDECINIKNFMAVPAIANGQLLGQITLVNHEIGFTEKQFDAVVSIAKLYASHLLHKKTEHEITKVNKKLRQSYENLRITNHQLKTSNQMLWNSNHKLSKLAKQLNCLHGISKITEKIYPLDETLQLLTEIIPSGWQYPDITAVRINIEDKVFKTENYKKTIWSQASNIVVNGRTLGVLEVCYLKEKPHNFEGPFLAEERKLINIIAERLSRIIERKQAENEVKKSEKKYYDLVQLMNEGLSVSDENYKFTFVNNHFLKTLGYSLDEVIGHHINDFLDEQNQKIIHQQILRRHLGQETSYEITWNHKDGSKVDSIISPKAFFDENGKFKGSLGIFIDVTKKRQIERLLKESEQKYRAIFEQAADSIVLFDPDNNGIIEFNDKTYKSLGYTKEEFEKLTIFDIDTTLTHAKLETLKTKIAHSDSFTFDTKHKTKNNEMRDVRVNAKFIHIDGKRFIQTIWTDVTELKKNQRRIQSLAKFPSEDPFPVLRFAANGRILYSNLAGQILLKKWGCKVGQMSPPSWQNIISKAIQYNFNKTVEVVCDEKVFSFVLSPIVDAGYINVYGLDITLIVKAEQQILELNKQLEQRVIDRTAELTQTNTALMKEIDQRKILEREILNISERERKRIGQELHDSIGQQFTGIAFMAKVLAKKIDKTSPADAICAEQIVDLVNQATDQTRCLARTLHPIDIDTGSLLIALGELADTTSKLFRIKCHFSYDKPIPIKDKVAATHLYRIAQEAITNAIKHGKAKKIEISLDYKNNNTILSIENDGKTFSYEKLKKGNGMGLSIMNKRCDIIGGTLEISSIPKGGAVVSCVIPRANN